MDTTSISIDLRLHITKFQIQIIIEITTLCIIPHITLTNILKRLIIIAFSHYIMPRTCHSNKIKCNIMYWYQQVILIKEKKKGTTE